MKGNINAHLNEEDFADAALGEASKTVRAHMAGCFTCRNECERVHDALLAAGAETVKAAERPEGFWLRQQAMIAERLQNPQAGKNLDVRRPARVWAWAGAGLATAGMLAVILTGIETQTPKGRDVTGVAERQLDADDLLFVSVQQSVGRRVPRAFAPAAYLMKERNRVAQEQSSKSPSSVEGNRD
ncbi:MAG: hypothetical protein HY046_03220 [Acidobacteria bacterium]|nr:hypothetical protein [Acidobacteriota bacterium]